MDRFEKISTALVLLGLIAVLAHSHRRRDHPRLNFSASPCNPDYGPAYLLSALPVIRRKDDYADPVSYWPDGGLPYHETDGWE